MAHTSTHTADAFRGIGTEPRKPARQRSPEAKRRKMLVLACVVVVLGLAALTNYGPLHAYRHAKARLDTVTQQVSALQAKKTELQAELGKLGEAGYLETLARQELTYAKPGEQVYIMTGGGEGASTSAATSAATGAATGTTTDVFGNTVVPQAAGAGSESTATTQAAGGSAGSQGSTETGAQAHPGFFERLLNAIANLF